MAEITFEHSGRSYTVDVRLQRGTSNPVATVTMEYSRWVRLPSDVKPWHVAVHALNILGYNPRKVAEGERGTYYGPYCMRSVDRRRWNSPIRYIVELNGRPQRVYRSRS